MIPSDAALLALKYAGSTVAAAYGVYATVTDFKEDKNGKKTLSKKGRWGIALLLVSILINVSSDAFKDLRDHQKESDEKKRLAKAAEIESAKQADTAASQALTAKLLTDELTKTQELNRQLSETSVTTKSALSEAVRAGDPFVPGDMNGFTVHYFIPTNQPASFAYIQRINKAAHNTIGDMKSGEWSFRRGEAGYPDKTQDSELLANLTAIADVKLLFMKKGVTKGGPLVVSLKCGPETSISFTPADPTSYIMQDQLEFNCRGTQMTWLDGGGFRSYRDFDGANVRATPEYPYGALKPDGPLVQYKFTSVILLNKLNREIQIRGSKCPDADPFVRLSVAPPSCGYSALI
jgi:hypothetical protein